MMSDIPEDNEIARLMQLYAEPVADNGFSRDLMTRLHKRDRYRDVFLFFIAGMTAAFVLSQWSALTGWMSGLTAPEVALPDVATAESWLSQPTLLAALAGVCLAPLAWLLTQMLAE